MELFTTLFSDLLVFVYHCFDRIVIHSYLSGLSRPEQVVHFFRQVVGAPVVSKELLSQRTSDYQNWVEAFARNHKVRLCSALVTANGQEGCLRRLLHLQEHGAGADLPCHRAEVSHQGSQPPHLGLPSD